MQGSCFFPKLVILQSSEGKTFLQSPAFCQRELKILVTAGYTDFSLMNFLPHTPDVFLGRGYTVLYMISCSDLFLQFFRQEGDIPAKLLYFPVVVNKPLLDPIRRSAADYSPTTGNIALKVYKCLSRVSTGKLKSLY